MGLLEIELKEIRRDIKHYRAGKLKDDQVHNLIAMYTLTYKRMCLMNQVMAMAAKHGSKYLNKMIKANLLGNGTLIDLSPEEIEEEKVYCELQDKAITRSECLDYSGESNHMDDCKNCETGLANKKLLINGRPLYTV